MKETNAQSSIAVLSTQFQRTRALNVYRYIASIAGITTSFSSFFNGRPKKPRSIESAVHSAVVFFLSEYEDVHTVAQICTIHSDEVLRIKREHAALQNSSQYYRIYYRKLAEKVPTFFSEKFEERVITTEKEPEYVAGEISRIFLEREESVNSQEPPQYKVILINVMFACYRKDWTRILGPLLGISSTEVAQYRQQHAQYMKDAIRNSNEGRNYWNLYNYVFDEIDTLLKAS